MTDVMFTNSVTHFSGIFINFLCISTRNILPKCEFKLTPREYKARFDNATKRTDETYIYFVARLRNALRYYLRSRKCVDFETLCDLLIADKLKSCLQPGPLSYVLSLEGDEWFAAKRIAELADTFVANRPVREPERTRSVHTTQVVSGNRTDTWRDKRSPRKGQLSPLELERTKSNIIDFERSRYLDSPRMYDCCVKVTA